jgi:succinoglycan biosynthesis transport protein ExoP
MSSAPQTNNPAVPAASGMGVDDILFTLFRHKWLILGFICLGVAGAMVVRVLRPPVYVSQAKLLLPYIIEAPAGGPSQNVQSTEAGGPTIINTEAEILWTHDVVSEAVKEIGPARILAKRGGGDDLETAIGVVCSGLEVEQPPHTSILAVSLRHPDASVAQPVLAAILENYKLAHFKIRINYEANKHHADDLKFQLAKNEVEIRDLLGSVGVLYIADTKHSYQAQLDKLREDSFTAERELAEKRVVLDSVNQPGAVGGTNMVNLVPPEVMEEFSSVLGDLGSWRQKDRELQMDGKLSAHPLRMTAQGQIAKLNEEKASLLRKFPTLMQFSVSAGPSGTNSTGAGLVADLTEIRKLSRRVEYLKSQISNVQANAKILLEIDPKLAELERQHQILETNYVFLVKSLEIEQANELVTAGKAVNISVVEKPTPPGRDMKKLKKLLMMVFGGCVGCGLGLAFLIDFILDRTIKRPVDVERQLKLPVFLTIPDTAWNKRFRLPWANGHSNHEEVGARNGEANGHGEEMGVTVWNPVEHLFQYTEGLRERLMTYFETRNMNGKKPKLVGLTACSRGCGVTTLASGLAASLSKTGNGNVLLVDMNVEDGLAHSFHQGKPGCGLFEALEPEGRAEAQVEANLYVASMREQSSDKLVKAGMNRFNNIMPKLKTSDYDYIIFDMPPVTQTSGTARMSGYMDIVLLVLESEKTAQQAAAHANLLMKDSRANVATVLNKCRQYIPATLSHEF